MPSTGYDRTSERLREVREELGLTQERMGQRLGYSQSTYQRYESGKNKLPLDLVNGLKAEFSVNPDWLVSGEGEMFIRESAPPTSHEETDLELPDQSVSLPRVSFRASAGDGNFVTEKEVADHYVVDKRELRHAGAPNGLFVVEVDGESMKPEFRPGEWLIMQSVHPDKLITVDGVYLYRYEDMVQLKRLQRRGGRTLHVLPANDRYPDYTINIDDATDFELLGSVYARFERYS